MSVISCHAYICLCAGMCVRMRACVRACVRACARGCAPTDRPTDNHIFHFLVFINSNISAQTSVVVPRSHGRRRVTLQLTRSNPALTPAGSDDELV